MFNAEGCPVILEDNRQVGLYVSELVRKIQQKTTLVTSSDNLLLSNNQVFVDQAVYSKNRNFRTFLSSKFGKTAVLKNATKEKANYDEKKFCLKVWITYEYFGLGGLKNQFRNCQLPAAEPDHHRIDAWLLHHHPEEQ